MDAIAVRGLTRRCGPVLAVDHVSFAEANQLCHRVAIIHT